MVVTSTVPHCHASTRGQLSGILLGSSSGWLAYATMYLYVAINDLNLVAAGNLGAV